MKNCRFKTGDVITSKNGSVIIVNYRTSDDSDFKFIETGYEFTGTCSNVEKGAVVDYLKPKIFGVGYKGYKGKMNTSQLRVYHIWRQMLRRCYSGDGVSPTYSDCSVDERWHSFIDFYEWYRLESKGKQGLHLDKDIKIKGNKIYSPEHCLLFTRTENNQCRSNMIKRVFIDPSGSEVTIKNRAKFAKENGLTKSCLNDLVSGRQKTHRGWTYKADTS